MLNVKHLHDLPSPWQAKYLNVVAITIGEQQLGVRHCWSGFYKGARGHPFLSQVKQRRPHCCHFRWECSGVFSSSHFFTLARARRFPFSHVTKASLAAQHVIVGHDGDLILFGRTSLGVQG